MENERKERKNSKARNVIRPLVLMMKEKYEKNSGKGDGV